MKLLNHPDGTDSRDTLRDRIVERETKKRGLRGKIDAFCCHCIYDPGQEPVNLQGIGPAHNLQQNPVTQRLVLRQIRLAKVHAARSAAAKNSAGDGT